MQGRHASGGVGLAPPRRAVYIPPDPAPAAAPASAAAPVPAAAIATAAPTAPIAAASSASCFLVLFRSRRAASDCALAS